MEWTVCVEALVVQVVQVEAHAQVLVVVLVNAVVEVVLALAV